MDDSIIGMFTIDPHPYFGITPMSSLDEVLQYRRQVEQAREQVAKAEGRLESAMDRLSHGFGCSNVKAGRKTLEQLRLKREKAERIANRKLTAFSEKWKDKL